MKRARALFLLLLAPLALGQGQAPADAPAPTRPAATRPHLVPALSHRNIEIRYSFSGAELLLYGAIVYPRGRMPAEPPAIAVVLKGPMERIVVREKQ